MFVLQRVIPIEKAEELTEGLRIVLRAEDLPKAHNGSSEALRQRLTELRDLLWETAQKAYAACGGARLFVFVNEHAERELRPTRGAFTPIYDEGVFSSVTLQSLTVRESSAHWLKPAM